MSEESRGYFWLDEAAVEIDPSFPPTFTSAKEIPFVHLAEGIRFRPVFGRNILFNYVYFDPHAVAPLHQHPEEQVGTVLEGKMEFEMNGVKRTIRPGDVYVVPPHVPHGARSYDQPCVALDIFSPPRSGFREMLERAKAAEGGGAPTDPVR
jgi:quercetin dioxygenase-like cupin family protein